MTLELVVRGGTLDGRVFAPAEGQVLTLGRGAHCDIRLDDEGVSRRHCAVERRGGRLLIRDLRSANGTFVNGERVTDARELRAGDRILVGRTWLECRTSTLGRGPGLTLTTDEPATRTVVRRKIEPGRFEWLTTPEAARPGARALERAQRHLAALHELSELLARAHDVDALFDTIVATVLDVTGADRAALLLRREGADPADPDAVTLVAARARHADAEPEIAVSRTVVRDVLANGVSTLSRDAASDARYRDGDSIVRLRIRSVMCAPLRTTEEVLGVLYVDHREDTHAFDEGDLELLAALGNQAGVALHRARLVADLERLFLDTVRAIAATIDAKDGYTHRHSERVAALAVRLARALGCSEREQRAIELAGLLHDLGKIAVPESILNKPDRLTDAEFEEMKKHPLHGVRILSVIQNPQMAELLPGIRSHHERWDGSGYPQGLRGEEIPLAGRILAVADFLDALTSARSYRDPLPLDEALARLREGRGRQFDPRIVDLAVELHARGELLPEPADVPDEGPPTPAR